MFLQAKIPRKFQAKTTLARLRDLHCTKVDFQFLGQFLTSLLLMRLLFRDPIVTFKN